MHVGGPRPGTTTLLVALLKKWATGSIILGNKGQKGILWVPTKKGYVQDNFGLRWDLLAFKLEIT